VKTCVAGGRAHRTARSRLPGRTHSHGFSSKAQEETALGEKRVSLEGKPFDSRGTEEITPQIVKGGNLPGPSKNPD